jgi:hypothetical protein
VLRSEVDRVAAMVVLNTLLTRVDVDGHCFARVNVNKPSSHASTSMHCWRART